ncbi:MAG: protein jag [Oscillospiraceae bacterium]|nr:protein jag [Oscillospiraceae bacterium]
MQKFIETTGRCEEDAIAAALFQLGLERDDVSVEVLQRPKNGFLGFGSNPAKVRVSYEVEGEDETPAPIKKETPAPEKKSAPEKKAEEQLQPGDEVIIAKEEPVSTPAAADDERAQRIRAFLTGLMTQLEVDAVPEISTTENGYQVVLQGSNLGAIIGRRGETLDAIQQLTNYAVNRSQSKRVRIHVDAEGYRAKREEALERLAVKVAGKVIKYRKNVTLEAMNAYERHVIHSALQDYPNVTTYSTGTEPNRRTVVAYAPGEHK